MNKYLNILFLLFLFCLTVKGQDTVKKVRILPVPTIGYSPETKTYLGAVTLFTFDFYEGTNTRTSNAKLEINYTWNKQLIAETEWNYFLRNEKWFTKGRLHYSEYPDFYYGVGTNTPEGNKLLFNSNRFLFEASVLLGIGKKFFAGPTIRYYNYYLTNRSDLYQELKSSSVSGAGFTVLKDSRNNILTPEKGFYLSMAASINFSEEKYAKSNLDLRNYRSWNGKVTWANRLLGEITLGNPPFFDYAFLGGDKFVRGYNYGRYRDKNLISWQTEMRFRIWRRLGLAAFGGFSNLFNESYFNVKDIKLNYGSGLRFMVDKRDRTNLRLDYAAGNGKNSGFYIAFGESF